jgi:uncharacterized protein YdeI (BOF family)
MNPAGRADAENRAYQRRRGADEMTGRLPKIPSLLLLAAALGACNLPAAAAPTTSPDLPAATPASTRTDPPAPAGNPPPSPTPTRAQEEAIPCNAAGLIADVSIPEGWQVGPSEHFTKTWRLKNTGRCAWNAGYFIIFEGGHRMAAPDGRQLTTGTVRPGETIDLSLDLMAPGSAGSYQGEFKLLASDGSIFGVGPGVGDPLRVVITVVLGEPKLTTYQVGSGVVVEPGSTGDVTADCPVGTIATGGGFNGDTSLTAHFQGLNGNGWRVAAVNNAQADQTLTAYAICLADTTGMIVSQVTDDKHIYPDAQGQSNVTCPDGSVVSGIGYAFDPKGLAIAGGDRMGIVARIFAVNISDSIQTLRGQAACLTPFTRVSYLPIRVEQQIPGQAVTTLEAVCPPSTFLTGGSFRTFSEKMTVINLSKKPGTDTWIATAINPSGAPQWFSSFAICLNLAMM